MDCKDQHVSRLPEKFILEGLELANESSVFGVPLSELSKRDLIAIAAQVIKLERMAREEGAKRLRFFKDLNQNKGLI